MKALPRGTDLPVLLPASPASRAPAWRAGWIKARHGVWLALALAAALAIGEAQAGPGESSIVAAILRWTPLLGQGFALNVAMSVIAMTVGTAVGTLLGLCQISLMPSVRSSSRFVTQFFRNAPWLVLLFSFMLLLPVELRVRGLVVPLA